MTLESMLRQQQKAMARAVADECRGIHPPEWSADNQEWICKHCRRSLDIRTRTGGL